MHLAIFNICTAIAWILISAGAIMLNVGAGLIICGVTLAVMVVYLSLRFGVYVPKAKDESEKS